MPFTIGFLEIVKYVVPGFFWLAILRFGPWELPDEVIQTVEDNQVAAAIGLVIMSFVIGTVSLNVSFRLLVLLTSRQYRLVWPQGCHWPRVRLSDNPHWPFEELKSGCGTLLRRADPTGKGDMVSFFSNFRRRDPTDAKREERMVTFLRIALEDYSPGLAAEARMVEAEINVGGGLFLPVLVAAFLALFMVVIEASRHSFNTWAAVLFCATLLYLWFVLSEFRMLRLEEVRFVYRAFFICAPRDEHGRYAPSQQSRRPR